VSPVPRENLDPQQRPDRKENVAGLASRDFLADLVLMVRLVHQVLMVAQDRKEGVVSQECAVMMDSLAATVHQDVQDQLVSRVSQVMPVNLDSLGYPGQKVELDPMVDRVILDREVILECLDKRVTLVLLE